MSDLRNGWENIDEYLGIPGYGITSVEKFIRGRTVSIYEKVRGIYVRDFIIKSVSCLFIISNLILYRDYKIILIINTILLLLLIGSALVQINYFGLFKKSADPGRSSRDNLTSLLTFLKRKFPVSALMAAVSYMYGYIPGILLYFMVAYGYLKPFTPMSYFVYSFIFLIGIIFGYTWDIRQVRYHIKHIRICLSDLNDNALAMASETIESKRKQDSTIIVLIQVALLLGFIVLIAILKSVLT